MPWKNVAYKNLNFFSLSTFDYEVMAGVDRS